MVELSPYVYVSPNYFPYSNFTTISQPTFQDVSLLQLARHSLGSTIIVSALAWIIGIFPGHSKGGIWPLYIHEHYGPLNSQHLLDPYSFVHFGHGIISFYIWGTEEITFVNDPGLAKTLIAALGFEMLENEEFLINLFRENSGTSEFYRGDSSINVFGDLLSCSMGYSFSKYIALSFPGFYFFPIFIFILIELALASTIRDNMSLIIFQLLDPLETIQEWQEELIGSLPEMLLKKPNLPLNASSGYWSNKYDLITKNSTKYQRYLNLK